MNQPSSSPDSNHQHTSTAEGVSLRDLINTPGEVRELLAKFANGHSASEPSVFEAAQPLDPMQVLRNQVEMNFLGQAMAGGTGLPEGYQLKLHAALKSLDFSGMMENRPPKKERKDDYEYNARVGIKWRFDPESKDPQYLSRSRIDLFFQCQRCFYLRQREGLKLPEGYSPKLNIALDILLKREFDFFREHGLAHPLMLRNGLNGVPLKHQKMKEWRDAFKGGLKVVHKPTNLLVSAAPDDIWVVDGKASIVDYKSTFTEHVLNLEDEWKQIYKRQVELNTWLLGQDEDFLKLDIAPADVAYFVYANARVKHPLFSNTLPFETQIIPHKLDFSWIEPTLEQIKSILMTDKPPKANDCCEECVRREGYRDVLLERAVDEALRQANITDISDGVRRGLASRLRRAQAQWSKQFLEEQIGKWKVPPKPGQQELFPGNGPQPPQH